MKKKLEDNLLFILPSLKPSGGNRVFFEIVNRISRHGSNATIIYLSTRAEKIPFELEASVVTTRVGLKSNLRGIFLVNLIFIYFWLLLNKKKFQSIFFSDPFLSIVFFFIPKYKFIRYIQADDYNLLNFRQGMRWRCVNYLYKFLIKITYKRSSEKNLVFNSQYTYQQFQNVAKRPYFDPNIVCPGVSDIFVRKRLRDKDSRPKIGAITNKNKLKGYDDFLRVANDGLIESSAKFYALGNEKDFSALKPNIHYITAQSDTDVINFYDNLSIFIFPSRSEGFGLPPLEAMARGATCIIARCGGPDEYTIDGINCLEYDPGDIVELREKIQFLIENPHIAKKINYNAKATVNAFRYEKVQSKWFKISS